MRDWETGGRVLAGQGTAVRSRRRLRAQGDGGLLLLTQDLLESPITAPIEASARLTWEVTTRSGRIPDAVVLIGGGARIPLVRSVLQSRLNLPVIVPAQPEQVAAEGAALLAEPNTAPTETLPVVPHPHGEPDSLASTPPLGRPGRYRSRAPPVCDIRGLVRCAEGLNPRNSARMKP
ncbi:hypothetical protein ACFTWF_24545 [Rhodococcus sp. NPDC056960]|uniref:hypothetical protein n=1 Tax=Rhodococcus sp. NPDC056960 TaxID=3345982 RepID=UPI003640848D